jgi:hypothetical protein
VTRTPMPAERTLEGLDSDERVDSGEGVGVDNDADPTDVGAVEDCEVLIEEFSIETEEALAGVGVEASSAAQVVLFAAASVKYWKVTVFPDVVLWKYMWQTVELYGGICENIQVYGDMTSASRSVHEAVPS